MRPVVVPSPTSRFQFCRFAPSFLGDRTNAITALHNDHRYSLPTLANYQQLRRDDLDLMKRETAVFRRGDIDRVILPRHLGRR